MPWLAALDLLTERLRDGGPRYAETDTGRLVAEPWNAATALVFLGLVVFWALRLRGRYGRYPFLSACLPILAVGGVGGTAYHAFRASWVFLVMDFLPIYLLGVAATAYLWVQVRPRWWQVAATVVLCVLVGSAGRALPAQYGISLSYAALGLLLLAPVALLLARTRFRDGGWVVAALACFGAALFFRLRDAWLPPLLPMGTHWLWHLFGAAATAALIEYLYRLRGRALLTPAAAPAPGASPGCT